jgi:hypothetical protein
MDANRKLPRALRRAARIASNPWAAALAAVVILAAGGSGIAYAASDSIPSSAGVFTACYKTSGCAMRLIDPSARHGYRPRSSGRPVAAFDAKNR